jgi:cytoplasmic iron level regulating protein YaaA (DUF328/UPF0246 family)
MLYVLSPAKTLDYQTRLAKAVTARASDPLFGARAAELIGLLAPLDPHQVAQLMDLSAELAALNVGRYAAWSAQATADNSRPAALAFNGDVYGGLDASSLKPGQLDWAQQHLVILSGLYGVLRPLDRLQPYRLEMGTRLANPAGKDLYAFWGDTLAHYLDQRLEAQTGAGGSSALPVVVNLASQEYFKAVSRRALQARVVDCVFEEGRAGGFKIISFFAKRARGLMARWAVQHKVANVKALQRFDVEGYAFDAAVSSADRLVFRRSVPA